MPRIMRLTNENKLIEEKANFFSDWFHFYLANIGNGHEFELENPLSLIEKITYQLENNLEQSHQYLRNYFSHDYFINEDYLTEFHAYKNISSLFQNMRSKSISSSSTDMVNFIKKNNKTIELLNTLREDLHANMFSISLTEIISFLKCICPLNKHIEGIKFHTKILVTEYLLSGRSKNDINTVFSNILSDDISRFPFPKDISSVIDKENHIKNRGIDGQFKGLKNLLDVPANVWTFYIKVYGAEFDEDVSFTYNEVCFKSKENSSFTDLKGKMAFFDAENAKYFVASVSVNFFSQDIAIQEAREKIKMELIHLSLQMNRELALDVDYKYLVTSDNFNFHEANGGDQYQNGFDNSIMLRLQNTPFSFLKEYTSHAKNHFLYFEYILVNAIKQKSMPDHWHYLETILQLGDEEKGIQDKVSSVVLLLEAKRKKDIIIRDLKNAFTRFNFPYELLNLTHDDLIEFHKSLNQGEIHPNMYKIDYPIIKILIKEFNRKVSIDYLKKAKKYYTSILKEAYEQRNFYLHQAISNKKANIKLQNSLPYIVQYFRWAIFEEIKNQSEITFKELLNALVERGNSLIARKNDKATVKS